MLSCNAPSWHMMQCHGARTRSRVIGNHVDTDVPVHTRWEFTDSRFCSKAEFFCFVFELIHFDDFVMNDDFVAPYFFPLLSVNK